MKSKIAEVKEIGFADNCYKVNGCLKSALGGYKRKTVNMVTKEAAVLVPLYFSGGRYNLILTKRTKHLPYHSGEISFPGGSKDDDDSSAMDTALRETFEEINLSGENLEVLGKLDDQISVADMKVTPYIGFIRDPVIVDFLKPQESEVEEIFSVPLDFFYHRLNYWEENWIRNAQIHPVYFYNFFGKVIWGLTGKVIKNLIDILNICADCRQAG